MVDKDTVIGWKISRYEAVGQCDKCSNLSFAQITLNGSSGKIYKMNLCKDHINEFILELQSGIERAI